MDEMVFKGSLIALMLLFLLIRAPYAFHSMKTRKAVKKSSTLDRFLLFLCTLGMMVFPLAFVFTPVFDGCSLGLPDALRVCGAAIYLLALVLIFFVHRELGKNWSMQLTLDEGHQLVTSGPYRYVRHPMYTAFSGMMIGQFLLTSNWFVGGFGIVAWTLMFMVRIPHEEQMMIDTFGDQYRQYRLRTGALIPLFYDGKR